MDLEAVFLQHARVSGLYHATGSSQHPGVLDHYQAQLEDQGWEGEPSELSMEANKLNVTWLDEESNAGVMVIYIPELWQAIVCVGNP